MNAVWRVCLALGLGIGITSCSNDFEITEGVADIPVVYGLLSSSDTALYIRVEKAFVDENTSAITLAKDPENLYYKDIQVEISNGQKTFTLQRVDGNLEGYPRKAGAFASSPNYLYKIKQGAGFIIEGQKTYSLTIKKTDGSIIASAQAVALRPLANLDITNPNASALLSFGYNTDFTVGFRSSPLAYTHDISLVFEYTEEKNGTFSDKTIEWPLVSNYEENVNDLVINYRIKGRAFYEFLKSNLTADPAVNRFMRRGSIKISSGGEDIAKYTSILKANTGITSSGEIPSYTNITNGVGLFSSKTTFVRQNIGFANQTLDSLKNGTITKSLNFR